ncbi:MULTISPECIES: contact-dependent growth inhibition system immunity protein [Peribacillus]|uniref:contact-dependent growth inhibition system immunity protein n=1 Tax=Peribacillus TaxID=2675229 RepID=UPI00222F567A|nr:contact-dependent growth inhibition system immunity protein [Peribacillus frigoritolerans]MDM5312619.1 contact-dependent growth inhibition system immunity protein [Peribacillus frigoritolerans]UZD46014.1 contact-dependent growth inhibition system immunity protein [Peribacillus frigoritolerans]
MKNKSFDELENFLTAHFHQDMVSPDEELKEFVNSISEKRILLIANEVKFFLAENISNEEKENFIEECCELYFPSLGVTPIQWLENIARELEKAIQKEN